MDANYYLNVFQKAAGQLDKKLLAQKQVHVATGEVLKSIFLKLYKPAWTNKTSNPMTAPSRIFFSVWTNDKATKENKLMYNTHAFKLRQLQGYSITSREFANDFRKAFKQFEKRWPNVNTRFGPLTLMEGWVKLDTDSLQNDVLKLGRQFLEIDSIIDGLLEKRKR